MMKPSFTLFALVPFALLLGACTPSFAADGKGQVLGETDAGKTVNLQPGQQVHIVLSGNPTTGYVWELAQADQKLLKSLGQPKYKAGSKAIGSGGSYDFLISIMKQRNGVAYVYSFPVWIDVGQYYVASCH